MTADNQGGGKSTTTWILVGLGCAGLVLVGGCFLCTCSGMMSLPAAPPPAVGEEPAPQTTPPATSPQPAPPAAAPTTPSPDPEPPPSPCAELENELPPLERRVALEVHPTNVDQGRPIIVVRTNLPDQTNLMFSVRGPTPDRMRQSRASVSSGCAVSETFSDRGEPLGPGRYTAGVTMPIVGTQPEAIRSILGDDGANLRGPLVADGVVGRVVEASESFSIGTATEARTAARDRRAEARRVRRELAALIADGRRMERLRNRENDLNALRQCGERMRQLQARGRQLRTDAESIVRDSPTAMGLSEAATHVHLCVSCLDRALSYCRDAERGLRSYDREHRSR